MSLNPRPLAAQLVNAKRPDGDPLFKVVQVQLLCDACRLAGEISCVHRASLPSWKTGERQELVKTLMERNAEMYKREALGIITDSTREAFNGEYVDRMARRESDVCVNVTGNQKELYVAIDPAGGGVAHLSPSIPTTSVMSSFIAPITPCASSHKAKLFEAQTQSLSRHASAWSSHAALHSIVGTNASMFGLSASPSPNPTFRADSSAAPRCWSIGSYSLRARSALFESLLAVEARPRRFSLLRNGTIAIVEPSPISPSERVFLNCFKK